MRKHMVKISILVTLVILCVWQIITLWFGDMSSHNFLVREDAVHSMILVAPKAIWINIGGLAYRIDGSKNEYSTLVNEQKKVIQMAVKTGKVDSAADIIYKDLLSMPGILYEYDLGIGLQDLVGGNIDKLKEDITVHKVFIDMSTYNDNKVNLYLVGADINNIYKTTVYKKIQAHQKMLERFNASEVTDNLTEYQPSIMINSNIQQYIKDNSFLLINNQGSPIEYEVLEMSNPIEVSHGEDKLDLLEGYVNSFFVNPLLKQVDQRQDGSIIFSENMRAIVKYEPVGTLEFNITSADRETNLSSVERLIKIMSFIETSSGIPEFLKEGIYLSQVINEGEEYIYKFNYKYKGFGVQLTNKVREELGIDTILELRIKNNQVTSGKWSILDIGTHNQGHSTKGKLLKGYDEVIGEIYKLYVKGNEIQQLDLVNCKYIMDTTTGKMQLNWVVLYDNNWYYP